MGSMTDSKTPGTGMREALIGASFVFVSAVGFSAKAILIKLAYRWHVDALTLLTLRMIFAAPFFVLMVWWGETKSAVRVSARDMLIIAALGLVGFYLSVYLDFLGLQYISAGLERLILFLYPTFVVLLAAIFLGRTITRVDLAALALSYIGVAFAFHHEAGSYGSDLITGSLLIFGSTLAYSVYLVTGGEVIRRVGAARFTGYVMIFASMAIFLHFGISHDIAAMRLPVEVYKLALVMGIFATVLPGFLLAEGMRRIGASKAAIISSAGPVATIFLAYIFLGETVSQMQMAGTALIIAGVLLVGLRRNR